MHAGSDRSRVKRLTDRMDLDDRREMCARCRPHRGCNAKRRPARPTKERK
jgi:hypothetical protein